MRERYPVRIVAIAILLGNLWLGTAQAQSSADPCVQALRDKLAIQTAQRSGNVAKLRAEFLRILQERQVSTRSLSEAAQDFDANPDDAVGFLLLIINALPCGEKA